MIIKRDKKKKPKRFDEFRQSENLIFVDDNIVKASKQPPPLILSRFFSKPNGLTQFRFTGPLKCSVGSMI